MVKKHYEIIDFMRAILITLVILIHIVNFGNLYPGVKSSILAFLMPAFLLITGYLVNINKSLKDFALYILRIFLPYTIMVLGFMILSLYLPVRNGIESFNIPTVYRVLFITSIGPYWFFHAMIVCAVIYYFSFNVFKNLSDTAKFSIFAFLLLIVSQFTPFLSIRNAFYYFLGAGIRIYIKDFTRIYKSNFWPILPFALLITNKNFQDWGTVSVLVCVGCFFSFISKLFNYFKGDALTIMNYIGRNTFPIYMFHPIFTMIAKFMLPIFIFDKTGILHAVITIILSLAGSLGIGRVMDYFHLSYIFGKKRIMR